MKEEKMMKRLVILVAVIVFFLPLICLGGVPQGVSPGGEEVKTVTDPCPTFSWAEVKNARGYVVEVYETESADLLTHEEIEEVSEPVLRKEVVSWFSVN